MVIYYAAADDGGLAEFSMFSLTTNQQHPAKEYYSVTKKVTYYPAAI